MTTGREGIGLKWMQREGKKAFNLNRSKCSHETFWAFLYGNMNVASSYMLMLYFYCHKMICARAYECRTRFLFYTVRREISYQQTKKKKQFTCKEWAFAFLQQLKNKFSLVALFDNIFLCLVAVVFSHKHSLTHFLVVKLYRALWEVCSRELFLFYYLFFPFISFSLS